MFQGQFYYCSDILQGISTRKNTTGKRLILNAFIELGRRTTGK